MAKSPRVQPTDGSPQASPPAGLLTADESRSPLFKTLRDIDAIESPEERLLAALDRLEAIGKLALGRTRLTQNGILNDPDCNAAVKVEEVAHRLLSIEPRKQKPNTAALAVFSKKAG